MTNEQKQAVEKAAKAKGYYESDKEIIESTPWEQFGTFFNGARHIINNPSDFGLVTKEEMFAFAEFTGNSYFQLALNIWMLKGDHRSTASPHYTTSQLFEIFKTKQP